MSKLYRYSTGQSVDSDGVYAYLEERDSAVVDGLVYAKADNGVVLTLAGPDWCASPGDAKRVAVHRLRGMAAALLAQADRLAQEADHAAG